MFDIVRKINTDALSSQEGAEPASSRQGLLLFNLNGDVSDCVRSKQIGVKNSELYNFVLL